MAEQRLRAAELIASLSFAADLAMGYPLDQMQRACLVAVRLAERMGLSSAVVSDAYYLALLRHVGCTFGSWFLTGLSGGDDIAWRRRAAVVDFFDQQEVGALFAYVAGLPGAKPDPSALPDPDEIWIGECEMGMSLATSLGLGPGIQRGMHLLWERWDGKGPRRVGGDDLPTSLRVARVALFAVESSALVGMDSTLATLKRRAGGWFDPGIAETLMREAAAFLGELPTPSWDAVLDAEPEPRIWLLERDLDRVAHAIADMADLRAPFLHGHSAGVGVLAEGAARHLGMSADELTRVRRAANVHDIGRHGVPNGVWEKPGRLSDGEWERVRLHPYYTERILSRSGVFSVLGALAGMHHERLDGSGYHRGAAAGSLPMAARIIAAADAFQAMTQERPYRPARSPAQAAGELITDARAGRLDPDAATAVCEAGGEAPPRLHRQWPAGLSDREVEVLRLVARGRSKREAAVVLTVSENTVDTHVRHVYEKIGVSTRAGAVIFAMEHDLLSPSTANHVIT